MMLNHETRRILGAGAVITTLVAGCGSGLDSPQYRTDAGAAIDVGVQVPAPDAAIDALPGTPNVDAGTAGREDTAIACADFLDDDHSGAADCADTVSCGHQPICCVGSTEPRCCAPPTVLAPVLALGACTSGVLSDCTPGMTAFGSPTPTLTSARHDGGSCAAGLSVAPQGSDRSDGGLVALANLDTTAGAVAIDAVLGVASTRASTLDAVAVGLTQQTDLTGSQVHVRPVVAIVVSATDQTIRAIAGDVAFPTHALSPIAAGCTDLEVRIVTSPAGTFDASYRAAGDENWSVLETGRPYGPVTAAHVVTYGRSTNPGIDGVHAWARSISAGRTACDVLEPARATSGAFVTLPGGGIRAVRSVSRVGSLAVYEMDGAIYVAGVDGTGHLQALNRPGTAGDQILAPGDPPFMAQAVIDPEIVAIEDNRRLFFTAVDAMGVRSIGYVDFDAALASLVTGSMPRQLVPPSVVGAMGVDGPAYFETTDGAVHRYIVFRAIVDAGHTELRAAELAGSSALLGLDAETRDVAAAPAQFYTTASPLQADTAFYANRAGDENAFDHDEISSPEIIAYGGVIRVFFAARHGARWSIGVLRSPDFAHFELAYTTPVLSGSGAGFDAVSVSDPDVSVDGGGHLSLYYTASDGTASQPGLATQEVPSS
jgi:hypothetical protein